MRGDMIQTYKLVTRKDDVNPRQFFKMQCDLERGNNPRGHGKQIHKQGAKLEIGFHRFARRVITPWNNLSKEVVHAESTSSFKGRYDELMKVRAGGDGGASR